MVLILRFQQKFILTPMNITLPLTAGAFFPSVIIGTIFGRLWGEIMVVLFPTGILGSPINPSAYAIVGGAVFPSCYTQTTSAGIIVLELVQNIDLLFPVLVIRNF